MGDTPQPTSPQTPSADAFGAFQDRFARNFAAAVSALLNSSVTVSPLAPAEAPLVAEAGACRLLVGHLAGGSADASSRPMHLELSGELAFAMVDRLLGGPTTGGCHMPDRSLTAVERRVLRRLAGAARASVVAAWPTDAPAGVLPADDATEAATDPPASADGLAGAAFLVTLAGPAEAGAMWLYLPDGALPGASGAGQRPGRAASPVEVSAELPETTLPEDELARLGPGDLLASGAQADEEVVVRVAGIPRFIGRIGRHKGRRAATIIRRLEDANGEAKPPPADEPADPPAE